MGEIRKVFEVRFISFTLGILTISLKNYMLLYTVIQFGGIQLIKSESRKILEIHFISFTLGIVKYRGSSRYI